MPRPHRPLLFMSAVMAALAVVATGGLLLDDRTLDGTPVWAKPLKFALSLGIYGVTWSWLISLIPLAARTARWSRWLGTVLAAAALAEMAVIVIQAARGRRSHFNVSTPLDSTLYSAMGTTIIVLMVANVLAAVLVARERRAEPADAWAVRIGLAVSAAGMALGYLMVRPSAAQLAAPVVTAVGAHGVGVADGGPGLPLLGWSTIGGDLRVPHFVGMHALQALPLLALAVRRVADRTARLRLVAAGGLGYAGLTALVTWQALCGQPLLRPDGPTLAAAGLLLAVTAAVALSALPSLSAPAARRAAAATPAEVKP
ncbi:hypothetical protein GCM10018953_35920 [Streptosporangium nondiastaticum]|uniref:hypothetical protein n=1 Tax=Streptosporangium nondiastaticum TaxID=35764 RepID=UPI0031F76E91